MPEGHITTTLIFPPKGIPIPNHPIEATDYRKNVSSAHLNKDKIESNLSVPGSQGHQENALIKSFEMSPHLICL